MLQRLNAPRWWWNRSTLLTSASRLIEDTLGGEGGSDLEYTSSKALQHNIRYETMHTASPGKEMKGKAAKLMIDVGLLSHPL